MVLMLFGDLEPVSGCVGFLRSVGLMGFSDF